MYHLHKGSIIIPAFRFHPLMSLSLASTLEFIHKKLNKGFGKSTFCATELSFLVS
jgi:hypothetical protein